MLEVNLVGAYLPTRAVVARMRAQAAQPLRGHVVSIASIQGKEGMALAGAYSAAKAGLMALTRAWLVHLEALGEVVHTPPEGDDPVERWALGVPNGTSLHT